MTSLLTLLERESSLMKSIDRYRTDIHLLDKEIDRIRSIDIECEAKNQEIYEKQKRRMNYSEGERRCMDELEVVRDEIRIYLKLNILLKEEPNER